MTTTSDRTRTHAEAERLMALGWTAESAFAHVEGMCDRVYCTGSHLDTETQAQVDALRATGNTANRAAAMLLVMDADTGISLHAPDADDLLEFVTQQLDRANIPHRLA